ncbi:MAG: Cof-type HAD-IIB family hydrolase [Oscillospiraceae bacterium]|nr:Cof-type HAD-IIB family hydrolase [Oscillospiraceae bacterium]MDE7171863.1 Cof-type HAD-IIB family hydrolase [Oscillospiraceae bacterium]
MIRLIASDIDGTLLPYGEHTIPDEVFEEIHRLERKGILFCPASGRQYTSLRRLFTPVADRVPFLCENGAEVYGPGSPGPVLGKTVMERERALALCRDIVDAPGLEVLISGADISYLCPKGDAIAPLVRDFVGNNTVLLSTPEDVPEDIIKVSAYCPEGNPSEVLAELGPKWGQVFQATVAGEVWLDFTLADKGMGLTQLCAALGIGLDEVMAFGDNFNDESMLSIAGQPWIMADAAPALREHFPNHCKRVVDVLRTL